MFIHIARQWMECNSIPSINVDIHLLAFMSKPVRFCRTASPHQSDTMFATHTQEDSQKPSFTMQYLCACCAHCLALLVPCRLTLHVSVCCSAAESADQVAS